MKTTKLRMLLEVDKKEKKKLIGLGRSMAEDVLGDAIYKSKEIFGDWPEDVVGQEGSDIFFNAFYREIAKRAKTQIKR
jgi:hypothetical protein